MSNVGCASDKSLVKITTHDPYEIPIFSATSQIVILRLASTIALILSTFSSVMDVLRRPGLASSSQCLLILPESVCTTHKLMVTLKFAEHT